MPFLYMEGGACAHFLWPPVATALRLLLNAVVPEKVVGSLQPAEPLPQRMPLRQVLLLRLDVFIVVVIPLAESERPFTNDVRNGWG